MFKHPKCGGKHDTANQARECETAAQVRICDFGEPHQRGSKICPVCAPAPRDVRSDVVASRSQDLPADVRAQARRDAYDRPARSPSPDRARVTHDGIYRNPATGETYKVQFPREAHGDVKRLYASLLVVDVEPVTGDDGEVVAHGKRHWTYVGGASKVVRPGWRLSIDEAKALGALYGTCLYGHPLTKEESIRKGIGPVCEEKYGLPI
jgi:Family of unknown function (DUF6011)